MMIIDEKKFNRLWTISKYICSIYPTLIGFILFIGSSLFSSNFFSLLYFIVGILMTIFILRSPRLGSYIMAGLNAFLLMWWIPRHFLGLESLLITFFPSLIVIFAYIAFGLLTELKETARQQ